jgi:hypothetical protein
MRQIIAAAIERNPLTPRPVRIAAAGGVSGPISGASALGRIDRTPSLLLNPLRCCSRDGLCWRAARPESCPSGERHRGCGVQRLP